MSQPNGRNHARHGATRPGSATAAWIGAGATATILAVLTGITAGILSPAKGFDLTPAVIATVGAALAALAAVAATRLTSRSATRQHPPAPTTEPTPAPPANGPGESDPTNGHAAADRATADRAVLVRTCIWVRDRVTSKALEDRLGAALHEAGVMILEPAHGVPFDAASHEAGSATASAGPELDGTIAAVEVPGYADRGGRVLRVPVVTVYQPDTRARRDR